MSLNTYDPLDENKEDSGKVIYLNLLSTLKNLNSLEEIKNTINSENKKLYKLDQSGQLTIEQTISFIKGLEYYKNQGGKVIFSGEYDNKLNDVIAGEVINLRIEDGKVKVEFTMDDGTPKTDEVELKDAFTDGFAFHCK